MQENKTKNKDQEKGFICTSCSQEIPLSLGMDFSNINCFNCGQKFGIDFSKAEEIFEKLGAIGKLEPLIDLLKSIDQDDEPTFGECFAALEQNATAIAEIRARQKYKHRKSGGIYEVLFKDARFEWQGLNGDCAVIYKSCQSGMTWIRPVKEFFDGRFEEIKES